jgi:hypothetical protein
MHVLGVDCTVHHARLPMPFVKRSMWINLAIDVAGIVKECFKVLPVSPFLCYCLTPVIVQVDMFALDFIQIHNSSARIKRVFALTHSKAAPPPSPLTT